MTLFWCCYLFLQVGDQVLELGGQSTVGMSHYEATSILRSSKDKIQLRVAENTASKSGWALFRTSLAHTCTCTCIMTKNSFCRIHCYQRSIWARILLYSEPRWPHPQRLQGHAPEEGWHSPRGEHGPIPRLLAGMECGPQYWNGSWPA